MISLIEKVLLDESGVSADVRREILNYLVQEIYDRKKNSHIRYPDAYTLRLERLLHWAEFFGYWNPVKERYFIATK